MLFPALLLLLQVPDLALADRLYQAGRFAEAAAQYTALLAAKPADAMLLVRLGACRYQLTEFREAEKRFRAALAAVPDLPPALVGWGTSLLALGRGAEAIPPLEKAVKANPGDRMAQRALGHAYQDQQRFVEGELLLRKLVTEDPKDAEAWYYLGLLLFDRNYAAAALDALERALALQPGYTRASIYRAAALAMLGRLAEAAAAFAILERDPALARDAELLLGHAQLLSQTGRVEEALALVDRGLAAAPQSVKLQFWRARLLFLKGELGAAAQEAQRAVTLDPELPNARHLLLQIYRRQGKEKEAAEMAAWLRNHSAAKAKGAVR